MGRVKRKSKICCLLNIAPLYRRGIFNLMDIEESVDFFFMAGDGSSDGIALMDLSQLSGFRGYMRNIYRGSKLIWQKRWYKALFKGYNIFILTGNPGIRSNWLIMLFAKLTGKKVILWTHGLYGSESGMQKWKNMLYMRMASHLLLYGNHAKRLLLKSGYKEHKMTVIYNSLDSERNIKLRDKYHDANYMRNLFGNNYPTVLFLGRLTPQKSLNELIEAIGILKLQGTMCNLLFVGEGPERSKLEELTEKIGIDDRAWFYGECFDEEMLAVIIQNSTMCVSPGNVGLTAIHALTYGIPVITHNRFSEQMPEFEAVRRGITGEFFKYKDSISLAETIDHWLNIISDDTKREQVKKNCYKMVDELYNPRNQINAIRAVVNTKI